MKKHFNRFILAGLIISGLGLLWLVFVLIVQMKNRIETFDSQPEYYSGNGITSELYFIIAVAAIAVLFVSTTIISLVRYRKGKAPGILAIIPMIVSAMGTGYILSVITGELGSLDYYLNYGRVGNWFEYLFSYLLVTGFLPQLIGYIILFIGYMGWFRKVNENTLPGSSASFSLAGVILYFGASVSYCFILVKILINAINNDANLFESILNAVVSILIISLVIYLAINIFVKCHKGKMPTLSLIFLLGISSAGVLNIFIEIYDGFKYSSMTFMERLEPLLTSGALMKLIVYIIFVIGTAGMLLKTRKVFTNEEIS